MRRAFGLSLALALLGCAALACNLFPGVPVTPTLAPTVATTAAPTATLTASATANPTLAPLITASPTLTPSATATFTATFMASPTASPSATPTRSATSTAPPTATASRTSSPTPTLLIVLFPTSVPSPRPTPTSFGIVTATPFTMRATPTGLPTLLRITTLRPTATPAATTSPAPTLSVPPLLATPGASLVPTLVGAALTPLPGGQIAGTPTPFPSLFALPGSDSLSVGPDQLQFPPPDTDPTAYASYSVSREGRRAVITREGTLIVDGAMFTGELGAHQRQRFLAARWSPDGRWLAYVVQRPDAEQVGADDVVPTLNDGVWVVAWPSGRPRQVFRSFYVRGSNEWPYQAALDISWSPDSSLIMVSVGGPSGERLTAMTSPAAVMDMPGPGLPPQQRTFIQLLPYTDGTWTPESTAWTARTVDSGRGTALVILPRDSSQTSTVLDGASAGLWIQNPARLPDGRYAFLGKPSFTGSLESGASGLRLYVMNVGAAPTPISPPIPGLVVGASWSPSRGSLLVYTQDSGAFVVDMDGRISAVVPGVPAVHWLP